MANKYRSKWVKCGKRCSGCPHGPYWYRYWYADGRYRSEYVGKDLPDEPPADDRSQPGSWMGIFSEKTASAELAREILGVPRYASWDDIKAAYRQRCMFYHPDRGGDEAMQKLVNCAFGYLQAMR